MKAPKEDEDKDNKENYLEKPLRPSHEKRDADRNMKSSCGQKSETAT